MNKITQFNTLFFLLFGFIVNAQTIVWTGSNSNNDFFDEGNWKELTTNIAPSNGSIDAGIAINIPLLINNVTIDITAIGSINLGTGSLSVGFANLTAESISGGNVTITEGGYIDLSASNPFLNNVQINFTSEIGWIKTLNTTARTITNFNLSQIKINGNASFYKNNLRLDNYYLKGCVIRSNLTNTGPLTIYEGENLQGNSASITVNKIHTGAAIANAMDNKMNSFLLKKGFMVTFADKADGTGSSKNYIASESDLVINTFPKLLQNSISFIRVLPWNWVTKKGRTDSGIDLNTTWRYKWNNIENSSIDVEYVPMAAFGSQADDNSDISLYVGKYNSTHVMAFNEADNCFGQSGQYGNPKLCVTDEAVRLYENLMKTGMRLVSPSGTEGAATGWLKEFHTKATDKDIRIDVIGVHWYDWGNNPSVNTNPTAAQVFARFKTYLTTVYNLYGLPIWITEFNANPYRSTAIQLGFMELALPYLETLPYVERYNWFQPNPTPEDDTDNANKVGPGEFYTTRPPGSAILTTVGNAYKNQVSSPSIPSAILDSNNNLNLLEYPNIALNKPVTANSLPYSIDNEPTKAVDGDNTSQWIVNIKIPTGTNYAPLPAWLEVDLQGTYIIDSFKMLESFNSSKDFSFDVWDVSLNSGAGGWRSVVNVTANPASTVSTFKTFAPEITTKVRVYITAHNSSNILRFLELEVYGKQTANLKVEQYAKLPFSLFPNPATSGTITIVGDQEVWSVEVYNLLGAKIETPFENGKLSVQNLAAGVYFLKINKQETIKFIKN